MRHPCNGDIGLQQQSGLCDSDDSAQFGLSPADDESETSDARTLKCRSAGRVAMRARSARPLPNPKCGSAVAATLATPPAPLSPVYTDVVRRESMAVTVLIGNFVAGYRATAVRARERNGSRAFNRDQAPATTTFGAEVLANNAKACPRFPTCSRSTPQSSAPRSRSRATGTAPSGACLYSSALPAQIRGYRVTPNRMALLPSTLP